MSDSLDHVLLTRFNLPSDSIEGWVRAQDGWLTKRVALFERYCLPSVQSQSVKNCRWIIYFDPESPEWLIDWIQGVNRRENFHPIFRSSVSRAELISDIRTTVREPAAELLTTNLDNDDGLSVDFAARLQATVCPPGRAAIYLTQGLIKEGDALFTRKDPLNAFCSVRESWADPITCWADWHTGLRRHMPVVSLTGSPAWLQVVHGTNVSNRVRGRRVPPARFYRMFPGLLDEMSTQLASNSSRTPSSGERGDLCLNSAGAPSSTQP